MKPLVGTVQALAQGAAIGCLLLVTLGGAASAKPEKIIGEVFLTAAAFCPVGSLKADGTAHSVNQEPELFTLIGFKFGGSVQEKVFALPDLRGRVPIGTGTGPGLPSVKIGEKVGDDSVTLSVDHLPKHSHSVRATAEAANQGNPGGQLLAKQVGDPVYHNGPADAVLNADATTSSDGGVLAVPLHQPSIVMTWCIATQGLWPVRP